jgi:hypothetical protein
MDGRLHPPLFLSIKSANLNQDGTNETSFIFGCLVFQK